MLHGFDEPLESPLVVLPVLFDGDGVAQVEILDPADRRGRALLQLDQQHGDDQLVALDGLGNLVQAISRLVESGSRGLRRRTE